MRFIRISTQDNLIFCKTEDEARRIVRHKVKTFGVEEVRNSFEVHLVEVPASRDVLYDTLNGTPVLGNEIGEYYITPRGALKRDRDA